jgi:hypothetical protein
MAVATQEMPDLANVHIRILESLTGALSKAIESEYASLSHKIPATHEEQPQPKFPSTVLRRETHPVVEIPSKPRPKVVGSSPKRRKETRILPPQKQNDAAFEHNSASPAQQQRRRSHERSSESDSEEEFFPSKAEKKRKLNSTPTAKRKKAAKIPGDTKFFNSEAPARVQPNC